VPTEAGRRLLLDAFIALDPAGDPVVFLWPDLQLTPAQQTLLDRLLSSLAYFGRAESWAALSRSDTAWPIVSQPLGQEDSWDIATVLSLQPAATIGQVMTTTKELRKKAYNRPPGSRWITYHVPPVVRRPPPTDIQPTLATFILGSPVPRSETLRLADRIRRRIFSLGDPTPTLLGRDQDGARQDGHRHLHILPEGSPALDRIVLWAPEGFAPPDLEILGRLNSLPAEKTKPALNLIFEDFAAPSHFGHATTWRSVTPYLCARHPKANGQDTPEQQILRECQLRGMPRPQVLPLDADSVKYKVHRGRRPAPPGPVTWHRLIFPQAISGPICLGASAHFGMGRFVPEQ
jgi:CRISPR-associated protein Csb2